MLREWSLLSPAHRALSRNDLVKSIFIKKKLKPLANHKRIHTCCRKFRKESDKEEKKTLHNFTITDILSVLPFRVSSVTKSGYWVYSFVGFFT